MKLITLLFTSLILSACATPPPPPVKTDLGEISAATVADGKSVRYALGSTEIGNYMVFTRDDPKNPYQQMWVKQRLYLNESVKSYDQAIFSELVNPEVKLNYKLIKSPPSGVIKYNGVYPIYNEVPFGHYVYYANAESFEVDMVGRPKDAQVSYVVMPVKTKDPNLFMGIYHAMVSDSTNRDAVLIDKFTSADGFEGYAISNTQYGYKYVLARSKDIIIAMRVNTKLSKDKLKNKLAAISLINETYNRQVAALAVESKPLANNCENYKNQTDYYPKCLAALDKVEADKRAAQAKAQDEWVNSRRQSGVKSEQFCTTQYGTAVNGVQTNTTKCLYK